MQKLVEFSPFLDEVPCDTDEIARRVIAAIYAAANMSLPSDDLLSEPRRVIQLSGGEIVVEVNRRDGRLRVRYELVGQPRRLGGSDGGNIDIPAALEEVLAA